MLERDIERYLVKRVKELGGEVRKVQWVGRAGAPDRFVMMPDQIEVLPAGRTQHLIRHNVCFWVELKNPETIETFPSNAHERAQAREHTRMRKLGQRVMVIGTLEQVDALLS